MSHDLTPWRDSATDTAVDPLIDAEAAIQRGQFGIARVSLRRLASTASDDDVRSAARTLLRRTAPDPAAWVVWLVLLVFITGLLVVYVSP